MIKTIAFDGDDTLWHHENYFENAEERFHVLMNELGHYPEAKETVKKQHIESLPLWGYGVKSFTLTMIETALKLTDGAISGNDIGRVLDIGRSLYEHPVILLDHVATTIQALHGKYSLVLITKGDLFAQQTKIAQSHLAPFFDTIEVVSEKDPDTYHKIMVRDRMNPKEFVMVGNSIKSDILPVLSLGAQAVHIPYHITWQFERTELDNTRSKNFITLPSMEKLPQILDQFNQSNKQSLADFYPADFSD